MLGRRVGQRTVLGIEQVAVVFDDTSRIGSAGSSPGSLEEALAALEQAASLNPDDDATGSSGGGGSVEDAYHHLPAHVVGITGNGTPEPERDDIEVDVFPGDVSLIGREPPMRLIIVQVVIALGLIILATAAFFVPLRIEHPLWMLLFLVLTAVTFSLLGFIIGIWADGFEKLQLIPLLIITPLTFLGGSFYSINMLPPLWQTVSLFNPVVYLVSGFRWSFYGVADVNIVVSIGMTLLFLAVCLAVVGWIFRTGYRLTT